MNLQTVYTAMIKRAADKKKLEKQFKNEYARAEQAVSKGSKSVNKTFKENEAEFAAAKEEIDAAFRDFSAKGSLAGGASNQKPAEAPKAKPTETATKSKVIKKK